MTAFIDIADAYKARLLEAPQIVGDRVERARRAALKKGWPDGIVVRMVRTRAQLAGVGPGAPKDWETLLGVEILARGATLQAAEDAVDALLAPVYERLSGWMPPDLAVEDALSDPSVEWDSDEGEGAVARALIVIRLNHRTHASALTAWGV
jgi:hypothetical protein